MPAGRPTKYKPEYCEEAARLSAEGATDLDLANYFGVAHSTLSLWKVEYPEFSESLRFAKDKADRRVEAALFNRAMGYSHEETDLKVIDNQVVATPMIKHYPPDTTALIFWLKNRKPDEWRDKSIQEQTGLNGGPIQTETVVSIDKATLADIIDKL